MEFFIQFFPVEVLDSFRTACNDIDKGGKILSVTIDKNDEQFCSMALDFPDLGRLILVSMYAGYINTNDSFMDFIKPSEN